MMGSFASGGLESVLGSAGATGGVRFTNAGLSDDDEFESDKGFPGRLAEGM